MGTEFAGEVDQVGSTVTRFRVGDARELDAEGDGWALLFHPDLIRRSPLAARMRECTFFGYESHEALHHSDDEQATLTATVKRIEDEYRRDIDAHSQELVVAHLQLVLTYCRRLYERQFNLRSNTS